MRECIGKAKRPDRFLSGRFIKNVKSPDNNCQGFRIKEIKKDKPMRKEKKKIFACHVAQQAQLYFSIVVLGMRYFS